MLAVYAAAIDPDDPLSGLEVGQRPDPEPASGWVDSSGSEIGDLCAWQGLTTLSLPSGSYAIQPLWSNNAGGCVASG